MMKESTGKLVGILTMILNLTTSRATLNGVTFIARKVPTLFTAMSAPSKDVSNPLIYGQINPFILKSNEVVEIVLINSDGGAHLWQ